MQLAFELETEQVVKGLRNALKQVRFAEMQACNKTAIEVQQFTVGRLLPSKFTLRSKGSPWYRPGTRMGFNVRFANKEKLESAIGSQANWLDLQERGGIKQVSGHRIAIPTRFWKARDEIMKREKKPGAILRLSARYQKKITKLSEKIAEGKRVHSGKRLREMISQRKQIRAKRSAIGGLNNLPFIGKMPSGSEGIYVRTGKERLPIKMIFDFEDNITVKPVLEFEKQGEKIVEANFEKNFSEAFIKALATAK